MDMTNNHFMEQTTKAESNVMDLRNFLYDLLDYKWVIINIALVVFIFGIFYIFIKIPRYEANVLMQISSEQKNIPGMMSNLTRMGINSSEMNQADIQSALIRSRFILEPVIQSLHLDIKAFPEQFFITKHLFPSTSQIQFKQFDVPLEELNKAFKVVIDKPNHFRLYHPDGKMVVEGNLNTLVTNREHTISINVKSIHAPLHTQFKVIKQSSAKVAHDLIERLKIEDIGEGRLMDKAKTGVLQLSLIDPHPKKLVNILNAIAKAVQIKDIERKSLEAEKTISFLNEQLPLAKEALAEAESRLNHYRAKSGKIDIRLQTQLLLNQFNNIDKQIINLRIQRMSMLQQYTTQHPFIISLDQKEKELYAARDQLQLKLTKLPASDQIAVNLMRDIKVKNNLYLILLNQMQTLQLTKAAIVSNVRILSLATLPDAPMPEKIGLILTSSLFLGLIIGGLIALGHKTLFSKLEDPQWTERHLNLVNLAIIPYSKQQADSVTTAKMKLKNQLPLLASINPQDLSIESLRSLRTSLQVLLCSSTNNIIVINGVSPKIGKSFISVNFSYLLAQGDKRVLLIDGDMRRGYLQNYFNVPSAPGLAEVLSNTINVEQAITKTQHENLMFLPKGAYQANTSELLMSNRFKELMTLFSTQFDLVVVDTAPVLAVTDGLLISALAGINLLVLGSHSHQAKEIEFAMKHFSNANIKLQGYIFNFLKRQIKLYGAARYNYSYEYRTENSLK